MRFRRRGRAGRGRFRGRGRRGFAKRGRVRRRSVRGSRIGIRF